MIIGNINFDITDLAWGVLSLLGSVFCVIGLFLYSYTNLTGIFLISYFIIVVGLLMFFLFYCVGRISHSMTFFKYDNQINEPLVDYDFLNYKLFKSGSILCFVAVCLCLLALFIGLIIVGCGLCLPKYPALLVFVFFIAIAILIRFIIPYIRESFNYWSIKDIISGKLKPAK